MGADRCLRRYRRGLINRTGLRFPSFAPGATHLAPFLAILQDPGNSGAAKSGICCPIINNDGTAKRQRRIIFDTVGLRPHQIVFWNFYAAFDGREHPDFHKVDWAREIERLIRVLRQLKAVVAFGGLAWRGMRDVRLRKGVALLGAPHPSDRAVQPDIPVAEAKIACAWQRAKELLDG